MKELTVNEIEMVAGAGIISDALGFVGDTVVDAVKVSNDILNTRLVSSVGQTFNAIGLGGIHYLADSLGYAAFKTVADIGGLLGGDTSRVDYHFEEEWGA